MKGSVTRLSGVAYRQGSRNLHRGGLNMWNTELANRRFVLLWILLLLIASGCPDKILLRYDDGFRQQLVDLKSFHTDFVDQFTAGTNKTWDQAAVQKACTDGDRMFDSVADKSGSDATRKTAVNNLYDVFKSNCQMLSGGKLYSMAASTQLKQELSENYSAAISGECLRAGAPSDCQ
jgi:hypothetical protein